MPPGKVFKLSEKKLPKKTSDAFCTMMKYMALSYCKMLKKKDTFYPHYKIKEGNHFDCLL